eukprot:scaffold14745_cov135-Isochrysis_galbana.AAC.1
MPRSPSTRASRCSCGARGAGRVVGRGGRGSVAAGRSHGRNTTGATPNHADAQPAATIISVNFFSYSHSLETLPGEWKELMGAKSYEGKKKAKKKI